MKLIFDLTENVETLVENTKSGKKYFIEGKFLSADKPNRNRRVYPRGVMESAVKNYEKEFINNKRALGELNHPTNGPSVNLDKACHIIESLSFDGSDVYGKARVLSTPMGEILKTLIDEKVQLGVSSRGLGSLKKLSSGLNEVQNDFYLAAVDVVNDPSGIGCFVNGIMENKEWIIENGDFKEISSLYINNTPNISKSKLMMKKLELFEEFLRRVE